MTVRRIERVRPGTDLTVGQLTLNELQAELRRRVESLSRQREELREKLADVEQQLQSVAGVDGLDGLGASGAGPMRSKRRMSAEDYLTAVLQVLKPEKAYTTGALCNALVDAGYNAKKSTLTQGMAAYLVESGVLITRGRKGRAHLYALKT